MRSRLSWPETRSLWLVPTCRSAWASCLTTWRAWALGHRRSRTRCGWVLFRSLTSVVLTLCPCFAWRHGGAWHGAHARCMSGTPPCKFVRITSRDRPVHEVADVAAGMSWCTGNQSVHWLPAAPRHQADPSGSHTTPGPVARPSLSKSQPGCCCCRHEHTTLPAGRLG